MKIGEILTILSSIAKKEKVLSLIKHMPDRLFLNLVVFNLPLDDESKQDVAEMFHKAAVERQCSMVQLLSEIEVDSLVSAIKEGVTNESN